MILNIVNSHCEVISLVKFLPNNNEMSSDWLRRTMYSVRYYPILGVGSRHLQNTGRHRTSQCQQVAKWQNNNVFNIKILFYYITLKLNRGPLGFL